MTEWVITSIYPQYVDLLTRWLPDEPYDGISGITVFTEPRDDLPATLRKILHRRVPEWPTSVLTTQHVRDLAYQFPTPLQTYTEAQLGFKVLLPLCVEPPFLFSDDDVLALQDPSYLFGAQHWGSMSGLDILQDKGPHTLNGQELRQYGELIGEDLIGEDPNRCRFNGGKTDAGVWYMPHIAEYRDLLTGFFDLPIVHTIAAKQNSRARRLDQRFLTLYIRSQDGLFHRNPVYRAWVTRTLPKNVPADGTFIQYCATTVKSAYLEWLHQEADKRGL